MTRIKLWIVANDGRQFDRISTWSRYVLQEGKNVNDFVLSFFDNLFVCVCVRVIF
jgi:hypothetical protein